MLDNPVVVILLMCPFFPGIVPVLGAFFLARHYDFSIKRKDRKSEEVEI